MPEPVAPTQQLVSAVEFQRAIRVPVTPNVSDIDALLVGAQELVERATGRPLIERSLVCAAPEGLWCQWHLPVAPVAAIEQIVIDGCGGVEVLDPASYTLTQGAIRPLLHLSSLGRPTGTVVATCRAGYAPDACPEPLRQAVVMITKDWLEANIAVDPRDYTKVAFGCRAIIRQWRHKRPWEVR